MSQQLEQLPPGAGASFIDIEEPPLQQPAIDDLERIEEELREEGQEYEESSARMSKEDMLATANVLTRSAERIKQMIIAGAVKLRRGFRAALTDVQQHSLVEEVIAEGKYAFTELFRGARTSLDATRRTSKMSLDNTRKLINLLANRLGISAIQIAIQDFQRGQYFWEALENEIINVVQPLIEEQVMNQWHITGFEARNIPLIVSYFTYIAQRPIYKQSITELIELELYRRGRPERVTGEPLSLIANDRNIGYILFQIYASKEPNIDSIDFPITPEYSSFSFNSEVTLYVRDMSRDIEALQDDPRFARRGGYSKKSKRRTNKHRRSVRRKNKASNKRGKTYRNKRRARK